MAEAYCVKDKKKVEVQNAEQVTMKNGKPALKGTCPVCGGKVYRIAPDGAHHDADRGQYEHASARSGHRRYPFARPERSVSDSTRARI